jgi:Icc-related predicted phosphoesterase
MEYQYNGAPHQYTEKAMEKRVRKLGRQIRKHRGFDIMITHAPAYRINDSEDLCHTGFKCFRTMIEDYHPQYLVHGHVHSNYGRDFVRESRYLDTTIINAFEKYIIEIDETALQAAK